MFSRFGTLAYIFCLDTPDSKSRVLDRRVFLIKTHAMLLIRYWSVRRLVKEKTAAMA
jgi:hypothetical protein